MIFSFIFLFFFAMLFAFFRYHFVSSSSSFSHADYFSLRIFRRKCRRLMLACRYGAADVVIQWLFDFRH